MERIIIKKYGTGLINLKYWSETMMKKIKLILLACTICFSFTIVLQAEDLNKSQQQEPKGISAEDLKLGNLAIGMTYEDVMKVMKKPKKMDGSEEDTFVSLSYDDGTDIVITYGRVQVISVSSRLYPTPRGLVVGDKKDKVLKLYGKPNIGKYKDSTWEYNMGDDPANFIIFFKGNKVTGLQVLVQEV